MLSIRVAADHHSWDEHLSTSMLAYRTSVHESTDYTPFKLMFGREVRLPVELMFGMPPSSPQSAPGYAQKLKQDQPPREGAGDADDVEDEDENSAFGWDATNASVPGTVLEEPVAAPAEVEPEVEPLSTTVDNGSTVVEPAQSSQGQSNTAETVSGSSQSDVDERAQSRPRRTVRPPAWLRDYEVGNIRRAPTYAEALGRHADVPFLRRGQCNVDTGNWKTGNRLN